MILQFLSGCVNFVNNSFESILGYVIAASNANFLIFSFIENIVCQTICGITAVTEDFSSFIVDVVESCVKSCVMLGCILGYTKEGILSAFCKLQEAAETTISCVLNAPVLFVEAVMSVVLMFFGAFAHIGLLIKSGLLSIISSIQLLPELIVTGIVYCIYQLCYLLVAIPYNIVSILLISVHNIIKGSINTLSRVVIIIYRSIISISMDSYLGLASLFLLILAFIYFRKRVRLQARLRYLSLKVSSLLRKLKRVCLNLLRKRVNQRPRVTAGTSNEVINELLQERESKLCCVCQDNPKSVILLPCRHVCVCNECSEVLVYNDGTCPVCRGVILNTMRVYL